MNFEMDGRSSIVFFTFLCELCKKSCELFDYKPNWNQDLEDLEASSQVVWIFLLKREIEEISKTRKPGKTCEERICYNQQDGLYSRPTNRNLYLTCPPTIMTMSMSTMSMSTTTMSTMSNDHDDHVITKARKSKSKNLLSFIQITSSTFTVDQK